MKYSRFLSLALLAFLGCTPKSKKESTPPQQQVPVPSGAKFHVAVMDSGFDVTHPVFKDKVVAQYTQSCESDNATESDTEEETLSFEELKAKALEELKNPKPSCTITEGIKLDKSPNFSKITSYRDAWNKYFMTKGGDLSSIGDDILDMIYGVLMGEQKYIYHGTATASLVAYKNTKVDLVLIQTKLASGEEQGEVECDTQANIDQIVALLNDEEYKKAAIEAPLNPDEKLIDDILVKHNIDFINTSFGVPATAVLDKMYQDAGCNISLKALIAAQSNLENKRRDYLYAQKILKAKTLTIAAAGNDGLTVNSTEDQADCDRPFTISVAATSATGAYTDFSNRGKCIDVKAPGEDIIVAFPELFVGPNSGTSFSSPLFVRYLTQTTEPQSSYASLYASLKDSNKDITSSGTPLELLTSNAKPISSFALRQAQKPVAPARKFKIPFH